MCHMNQHRPSCDVAILRVHDDDILVNAPDFRAHESCTVMCAPIITP